VTAALPSTVPEVIARMQAIEASAAPTDGVVCFTRLYREVTEGVNSELGGAVFGDPRFMVSLDVRFAGLFFAAVDAYGRDPSSVPSAWAPLFAHRSQPGIAPLQFALAGMNAHINRDLPVALVATWGELGVEPSESSPQHTDFQRVNSLLTDVEEKLKASYMTGWIARLDRLFHRLDRIDDVLAMWDVARARDAAWTNGEALWALRSDEALSAAFLVTLDRMVGFAGRGLLLPTESGLRRIAHRLG
jgi:Family of unknown function (DUF5995)